MERQRGHKGVGPLIAAFILGLSCILGGCATSSDLANMVEAVAAYRYQNGGSANLTAEYTAFGFEGAVPAPVMPGVDTLGGFVGFKRFRLSFDSRGKPQECP